MGTGTGLLFNQLSPKAFAHISWRYYAVFVGCDALAALCFFTIYPWVHSEKVDLNADCWRCRETKGKTLEEIAELFGDDVAFTEYLGASAPSSAPVVATARTASTGTKEGGGAGVTGGDENENATSKGEVLEVERPGEKEDY